MKVIIPAAGYATRLWPLTKETPKPLLPVKDKPIIEHIIDNVLGIEQVDEIHVVTNAKFFPVFKEWVDTLKLRVQVSLYNDGTTSNDDRLGQIGDIQFVIGKANIDDDLMVVAGDNLFNFALKDVYEAFRHKRAIINPLHDAKSIKIASEQGTVVLDADNRIVEFMEKAPEPKTTLVSQGVYCIPKDKVKLFKQYLDEGNNGDKMGYFMAWMLGKGEILYGLPFEKGWFDVGWKEALENARENFQGHK